MQRKAHNPVNTKTFKSILAGIIMFCLALHSYVEPIRAEESQNTPDVTHDSAQVIELGWIGAITGPTAKYGAYEAAQIAVDDANVAAQDRNISFQLKAEDGRCNSKEALNGVRRLIDINQIRYLIGGHCSNESLAIAPVAQKNRVIMMAAITSSPKLSSAGENIFRVTAPNTRGAQLLLEETRKRSITRLVTVYEETEYAEGLAQYVKESSSEYGINVVSMLGVAPGSSDFKPIVSRIRSTRPDAIYFSPQSPESTVAFLRAAQEQSLSLPILSNEIAGNAATAIEGENALFERLIFPEPKFDRDASGFSDFAKRYQERFGSAVPYGFWTAEAYDAVRVITDTILKCGNDMNAVRKCLSETNSYSGISGQIGFDPSGDGVRTYVLKEVKNGVPIALRTGAQ